MPVVLAKEVNRTIYAVELDPTSHYEQTQGIDPRDLTEWLGLIPEFMFAEEFLELPAWEALDIQYQHGGGLNVGVGTITPEGTFQYPEDPDLYPLAKYTRGDEEIYQYEHGLMAVPKDGQLTPTRMD